MSEDWMNVLASLRQGLETPDEPESDMEVVASASDSESKQVSPLRVIVDKNGRKGKTATIIEGFTISQEAVEELAKELKSSIGVGGSTREGEILIQGNQQKKLTEILKNKGFKVK